MPSTLTPEQQIVRMGGLGGSDMNALSGFSSRWRPIDVWVSKTRPPERARHEVNTIDQKRGIYDEPGLRRWYEDDFGCQVQETGTLHHPEHSIVLATPDGLATNFSDGSPDRGLEIKSPRFTMLRDWCPDGEFPRDIAIPRYYWPQLTWEAAVLGVDTVDMWVRLGDEPYRLSFPFKPKFFAALLELAERFWREHVLTGVPPSPDASTSYSDWLAERHPLADPSAGLKEASGDDYRWASQYVRAHATVKAGEELKREARNHLEASMADAPGLDFGAHGRVTNKNKRDKQEVDWPAVARAAGATDDLIQQHTQTKAGTRSFCATGFKDSPAGFKEMP